LQILLISVESTRAYWNTYSVVGYGRHMYILPV
jgi:hypothetical protein